MPPFTWPDQLHEEWHLVVEHVADRAAAMAEISGQMLPIDNDIQKSF